MASSGRTVPNRDRGRERGFTHHPNGAEHQVEPHVATWDGSILLLRYSSRQGATPSRWWERDVGYWRAAHPHSFLWSATRPPIRSLRLQGDQRKRPAGVVGAALASRRGLSSGLRCLLSAPGPREPTGPSAVAHLGARWSPWLSGVMHLEQFALIVDDYDDAIRYFVDVLEFELVEDSPSSTNDGREKRWVVVRPPGATTALLLARADGERQERVVGDQFAARVGLFLRVDDFQDSYDRMHAAGVEFVTEPRQEPYGRVVVFIDVAGNRWDLLGPPPSQ